MDYRIVNKNISLGKGRRQVLKEADSCGRRAAGAWLGPGSGERAGVKQLTRRNVRHRGLQPQGHLFLEPRTLPRNCPAGTTQVILFQNWAPSSSVLTFT